MKKRSLALLCLAVLACSLAACKGNPEGEAETAVPAAPSIGYDSTEVQELTSEKADAATLSDIVKNWLGGNTIFHPELHPEWAFTYEDFVEKIGVGATTYNKYIYSNQYSKEELEWRAYTWVASDDEKAQFAAYFQDYDGKWLLCASGSVNLM